MGGRSARGTGWDLDSRGGRRRSRRRGGVCVGEIGAGGGGWGRSSEPDNGVEGTPGTFLVAARRSEC